MKHILFGIICGYLIARVTEPRDLNADNWFRCKTTAECEIADSVINISNQVDKAVCRYWGDCKK